MAGSAAWSVNSQVLRPGGADRVRRHHRHDHERRKKRQDRLSSCVTSDRLSLMSPDDDTGYHFSAQLRRSGITLVARSCEESECRLPPNVFARCGATDARGRAGVGTELNRDDFSSNRRPHNPDVFRMVLLGVSRQGANRHRLPLRHWRCRPVGHSSRVFGNGSADRLPAPASTHDHDRARDRIAAPRR